MKKISVIILLLILTVNLVAAQDIQSNINDLEKTKNQVEDTLTNRDIAEQYLGQKWTDIIDEKAPWIYKANPIFKFLFGYGFELSWAFLAAFLLWAITYALFYPTIKLVMGGTLESIGITLAISAVVTNITVPKYLEYLSSLLKDFWHSFTTIIALLILVFVVFYFSSQISRTLQKQALERKIEKATSFGEAVENVSASAEAMKKGHDQFRS